MNSESMSAHPRMLFIGSGWRKSGKTWLVCHAIEKLVGIAPVIGLKVSLHRQGENNYHPGRYHPTGDEYQIVEELFPGDKADTAKMLKYGCNQSYLIRANEQSLETAFHHFIEKVPGNHILVAETLSLRDIVKPDLLVIIEDITQEQVKASAMRLLPEADLCIQSEKGVFKEKTIQLFDQKLETVFF